jgi:AraC-like DNA-binding protein
MEGTFLHILTKWFKKFERYKVSYKNGCYHLSNLFHSPATMIESFDKMAFCKHDRAKKLQTSDNIFLKSKMYYCHLEEELWTIVSNLYFKKNVLMRNLYDDDLPLEYHFITIHIKASNLVNKSMVNGMVLKNKTWSMYKAGNALTEYHFKNSEEKNITIFFTSKWLEKQKALNPVFKNSKLADFFDSENTHLILDETHLMHEAMCDEIMRLGDDGVDSNMQAIKQSTYNVLSYFIEKLNTEIISENHFKLNDADRKNIQRVEQYLLDNLFGDFPGIEKTAKKVGISPTKLKTDFKSMHDMSLYQYFSKQQMQTAHELLLQKKYTVKEIAGLLGYENASKFSAVFKKSFDVIPSEI